MKRVNMFLAASLTFALAGAALAADTRPTTTDEARTSARPQTGGPASQPACARTPSTTDEARAAAGAQLVASAVTGPAVARGARVPTSTDEARTLAQAPTHASAVAANASHAQVCASCACRVGEQHVRAAADPCGCHKGS